MLTVKKDFTYYHGGYRPVSYVAGQVVDIDDAEMIEVAIDQGWATNGEVSEEPAKAKPGRKPK